MKNNCMTRSDIFKEFLPKVNAMVAEIGVLRGEFTEQYLSQVNGKVFLIDMWSAEGNDSYFSKNRAELSQALEITMNKFKNDNRVTIIVDESVRASKKFQDNLFDIIYIDANHEHPHPMEDINAWLPKVKFEGIIAGHDFGVDREFNWGVEYAVRKIFGDNFSLTCEDKFKSWYGRRLT